MAVGDDAIASGYPLVQTTGEEGRVRWGAREINRTRDIIAQVKAWVGTIVPVINVTGWTLGTTHGWSPSGKVKVLYVRQNGTADANGLIMIPVANANVLHSDASLEHNYDYGVTLRNDYTNTTRVCWQMFSYASGAAIGNKSYVLHGAVTYQV